MGHEGNEWAVYHCIRAVIATFFLDFLGQGARGAMGGECTRGSETGPGIGGAEEEAAPVATGPGVWVLWGNLWVLRQGALPVTTLAARWVSTMQATYVWAVGALYFHFFTVAWVPKMYRWQAWMRSRAIVPLGSLNATMRDDNNCMGLYAEGFLTQLGIWVTFRAL